MDGGANQIHGVADPTEVGRRQAILTTFLRDAGRLEA